MIDSPIWNAKLLLVVRTSQSPHSLAQWYATLLGDTLIERADATYDVRGGDRRTWFRKGANKSVPEIVFAFDRAAQLVAFQAHLIANCVQVHPCPMHLSEALGNSAFAISDPDQRVLVFCVRPPPAIVESGALPARLQHFVCASTRAEEMRDFYRDVLGFAESDRVIDEHGELSAAFVRSDPEHHSFAVFRAAQAGPDHQAYEVPDWNAIRDWADRCGSLEIPLWWGPGRHGVGNNLFFMIEDPDGYKLEFSAELEHMDADAVYREWPHGPRALNLWGNAWMRS